MATNLVQEGNTLTVAAPSGGVSSGDFVVVGGIAGVAIADALATVDVAVTRVGAWTLPKNTSTAFTQGAPVYWSVGASECVADSVSTSPLRIGVAAAGVSSSATTVVVALDGICAVAAGSSDGPLAVDIIGESTSAAGVTVDGVLLKDAAVNTNTINELTSAAGVTIDGVLLKDSQVTTAVIVEGSSGSGVTADGVLLKDGLVDGVDVANLSTATVKGCFHVSFPPTANNTEGTVIIVPQACTVTGVDAYALGGAPSSSGGAYLLAMTGDGNPLLAGATFDLEGLSGNTTTALSLTATSADLILAAGDVIVVTAESDNADLTGHTRLAVAIRFNVTV